MMFMLGKFMEKLMESIINVLDKVVDKLYGWSVNSKYTLIGWITTIFILLIILFVFVYSWDKENCEEKGGTYVTDTNTSLIFIDGQAKTITSSDSKCVID